MSKTDADRNKFEAWVLKEQCPRFGWNENVLDRRKSSDEYFYANIRESWEAWQACAASKDAEIQALREVLRELGEAVDLSVSVKRSRLKKALIEAERVLAETEAAND